MGGGTSGRAIELFVHLFLTTLFHDFSEINWFVATNFCIHDVGYLENEIQETFEELVHNEKYLQQPGSHETHIHKFGLQICYKLACICVLKVTNQPKGKRKHRPKESTEVKPVLAPVKIYDSSCLLPIQKELGKNYM